MARIHIAICDDEKNIRAYIRRLIESRSRDDKITEYPSGEELSLPEILMEHGIGLRNVKEIAERYLGTMDITVKGKAFKVTFMLQQKEERNDEI